MQSNNYLKPLSADRIMWWGYLHENRTIQLKRWFGDHKDYTEDCQDNPFVVFVVPPFAADSYKEAFEILSKCIGAIQ